MLNVVHDKLVVESKGIYSIEKFLIARRLMYWQVYLHKTVLSAEYLMIMILKRVREIYDSGYSFYMTNSLYFFLENKIDKQTLQQLSDAERKTLLDHFSNLDDDDIMACIKIWQKDQDPVLSLLSQKMINRRLFKIVIQDKPFKPDKIEKLKHQFAQTYNVTFEEAGYFVFTDIISNNAYSIEDENIQILYNNGDLKDVAEASDMLNISVLSKTIKKYFLCYPKELSFNNRF
jgi:hypothetical protein